MHMVPQVLPLGSTFLDFQCADVVGVVGVLVSIE